MFVFPPCCSTIWWSEALLSHTVCPGDGRCKLIIMLIDTFVTDKYAEHGPLSLSFIAKFFQNIWSWHVQNCLQLQHVCTTIVGSFSFRLNLSDCLPSVLLSLPTSLLSFSPHPRSGWRQQKQVSDMVDYAGLHCSGRAGGGALSSTASPASGSSLSPHQVYAVSHSLYRLLGIKPHQPSLKTKHTWCL